jgi:hypothetical protein
MSHQNLITSAQVIGVLVQVDDGICQLLGREYFRNQERAGGSDECATRDHGWREALAFAGECSRE